MILMGSWLKFAVIRPERSELLADVQVRLAPAVSSFLISLPLSWLLPQLLNYNTHQGQLRR